MWTIDLDGIEKCRKLSDLCEKYKYNTEVDVSHSRYLIDGCSFLGVLSLLFNRVGLIVRHKHERSEAAHRFEEELEKIGGKR